MMRTVMRTSIVREIEIDRSLDRLHFDRVLELLSLWQYKASTNPHAWIGALLSR